MFLQVMVLGLFQCLERLQAHGTGGRRTSVKRKTLSAVTCSLYTRKKRDRQDKLRVHVDRKSLTRRGVGAILGLA